MSYSFVEPCPGCGSSTRCWCQEQHEREQEAEFYRGYGWAAADIAEGHFDFMVRETPEEQRERLAELTNITDQFMAGYRDAITEESTK